MKACPKCAGPLVDLRSLNVRLCADCKSEYPWHLAPGQRPLIGNNRQDRKEHSA